MKDKTPSIQLNMVMNTVLTMSSIIFPLITLPYVTRILGAEGVGKVYFASSVIAFFAMFAELGIPVYGIRACARVRDDHSELSKTVREIMAVNLITCAAAYIVFAAVLRTVPRLAEDRLLMVIMSSTMLLNAIGAEWLYKALEKYTYITLRSVAFKLIALAGMFMLIKSETDYIMYGLITIFAASASNIVNFLNLHRYVDLKPSGKYDIKRHLPGMLMLFALAAATTVYTNLDLAVLDFFKGDAEAGLYGVSVRIKLVTVSLVTSVSAVLLPRNSFYFEKSLKDDFYRLLSYTMRTVFNVSVPAACYFAIFAGESIDLLAGDAFAGAVIPMQIIMPSVVFIGISNIIGMQMLIPAGKEKAVVTAALIGAVTDMALNLLLIPCFASAGAAAATLAAEICVTSYMIRAAGPSVREVFSRIRVLPVFAAVAAASAAGAWVKLLELGPFVSLCISAVCFFAAYAFITYELLHRD